MIVVDASVAVKTYTSEAGTPAATELFAGTAPRLLAPDLIRVEVCGALWRCVRKAELLEDEAEVRCKHWLKELDQQTVDLIADRELVPAAIELSKQLKHPLADCLYLAVADRFDAALVTADWTLFERAKARFPKMYILPGCEKH